MRRRSQSLAKARQRVERFNQACPVGTEVRFWPGVKEGDGRRGFTMSEAFVDQGGNTPVVFVKGYGGFIALSHVEPVAAPAVATEGGAA